MRSPCFIALTRPVSFFGLPMTYAVVLAMVVIGGFVLMRSFTYLIVSGVVSYAGLRGLAAYDPKILDVLITVLSKTPPTPSSLKGRGVMYRD